MSGGSVSKSHIILEITNKFKIKCELKRHLSPTLVGTINRSLPVIGTIHLLGTSGVYVESHIESGGERTRNEFKKRRYCIFIRRTRILFFLQGYKSWKRFNPNWKNIG